MFMSRRVNHELNKLARAERSRDSKAIQKAYEDLFVLCRANHLDLPALLREFERHRQVKSA